MVYKEFGATIAPSNVSKTGFPIAMGTHIGGGRIVNDKTTLNSKHWCLLGEGATLNDQKVNAIGQIWYDTSDNKYWKLNSWASENPVWVDVSTIFATRSYVDTAIENIPDPMIFKGSLGTGGTITSLPTASNSNTGFTYKVITAGTYAGQAAKVGDTFISDGTIWNLIPSGNEPSGTVTSITLDATSPILINSSNAITTSGTRTFSHATTSGNKHIPSGGSANQILKWSADGTAVWGNEVNTHYTSKNIVSSSATGKSNATATNPYLNHIEESTVTSSHRISGSGATTVSSNATGNITISSTDTDTTYSFATGTTNGTFRVTPSGGTATAVSIYGLGTAAYTASGDYATSSHGHTIFSSTKDGFVPKSGTSTSDFLRSDGTWATPSTTYTLPLATSATRGGIKIGYAATGANLPLKLSSEKAYITLTSASITAGLGYTPYDSSTNPSGYTTNTGTVTEVKTGTGLSGGTITTTGTINLATAYGDSKNPYASKTAKYVLAAPNTSNGVPTFRKLEPSDIPILDQDTVVSAGSVVNSIKFDDNGVGAVSGVTYNGSSAFTVSYNTIGAAPSGRTITAGNGLTGGGSLAANRTLTLGTPGTLHSGTTNSVTSTSHTHAISFPNFYKADHEKVPSDNFDDIWGYENNVWECEKHMYNGVLNDLGDVDPNHVGDYSTSVLIQYGADPGKKIQMLFIDTNVSNVSMNGVFCRHGKSPWMRMLDTNNYDDLVQQITNNYNSLVQWGTNNHNSLDQRITDNYNSLVQWADNNFEYKQTPVTILPVSGVITITNTFINKFITISGLSNTTTLEIDHWNSYLETEIHLTTAATVPALQVDPNYKRVNLPGSLMPNTTYIIAIKNGVITFAKSI